MGDFLCLYFGTPGECQNCGGSTRSVGEDGHRGPFEGDRRYCSEDCYAESMIYQERMRRWAVKSWCPECGFDNDEHNVGCRA